MSRMFPDLDIYRGAEAPTRIEANVLDLEVEGEIPAGINGSFYRVQPDPQFVPRDPNDILFNGDGLIGAFHIANGHVDYIQRYAQTERFKAERTARQSLFGRYRNPFSDDPGVKDVSGTTSNTHVFVHGGNLLALKEDAMPTVLDPVTLETRGTLERFGGIEAGTFTAHPKIDPVSGDMIAFGYEARGLGSADLAYYVIGKDGRLKQELALMAPYAGMIHDWGVTQDYVVFPLMPLCSDVERMKAGLPRFVWRPDLPRYYGVMRRDGDGRDLRWFEMPRAFLGHSFNAFNDGEKVYLDMTVPTDNVFDFFPDADGHVPHLMTIQNNVTRLCFDMDSGSVTPIALTTPDRIVGDFPHCDDRYATLPYRYGFMTSLDMDQDYDYDRLGPPFGMFFNGVGRLDMHSGAAERWWAGPTSGVQEPVFVPRSPGAPEGDGYMLAVVNRLIENRCDLVILDTDDIAAGPIATCKLPFRLRTALHGNWVPAEVRDGQA